MNKGIIIQIMGPVVDVEFEKELPGLLNALLVQTEERQVTLEVAQHLGGNRVRTIAMDSTDGLKRKDEVIDTGKPIEVPIGEEVLGRMFNVLGDTIDGLPALPKGVKRSSIYSSAPALKNQKYYNYLLFLPAKLYFCLLHY